ncbi:MAG: MBL fold metallo-hydrolase [Candidatus Aenigmarchaeota archaeon]|nr:MBL fold metallo-hydrolase [Candidatus Aenigmarchaeota archaeon]MDW8160234.1 MBL fold metallo-hydrolase [Candidatus Aenigmarchaeota archaeon]
MMISFLGAMSCVGASGILVESKGTRLVLDYGTKPRETPPKFPLPVENPTAVLLSHAHLDHSGALPILTKKYSTPVYSLDINKELVELLLEDSIKVSREEGYELPFSSFDVERTVKNFVDVRYNKKIKIGNFDVTFFDAGHIPGSSMIFLESEKTNLLYTGDFNVNSTRLIEGCEKDLPKVKNLIIESTYSDRDHPERVREEKEMVRIVDETVSNGEPVLIAAFAVGRSQEVLLILYSYGINYPVYLDGMAKKATTIINKYKNLLRDENSFEEALDFVTFVEPKNRKKLIKQPCVIITTSGMLNGGPVTYYLKKLHKREKSSLILTGWQIENTPGRILLETGKFIDGKEEFEVKMNVNRLDFSAHAGRKELFNFIEKLNPDKIFCIHGDHTQEFAEELRNKGFEAFAPIANNRVFKIE